MDVRSLFVGSRGLRAGWSLLVANLILAAVLGATYLIAKLIFGPVHFRMTAPMLAAVEAIYLLAALLTLTAMGRIERRSLEDYGFPRGQAFRGLFWRGSLWGGAAIMAVVGIIAALGGYSVRGLALQGTDLILYPCLWTLGFLLLAMFEELFFRGYMVTTLARGIGFWPGAILASFYFGFVLHYLEKPGESWVDGLSVSLIALFLCLTLRRTGSLWFAIGWHFAFNLGSLFVFGAPNTANQGIPVDHHLLDSAFHGPQWLTGGGMGPEAGAPVFLILALQGALFHLLHPRNGS